MQQIKKIRVVLDQKDLLKVLDKTEEALEPEVEKPYIENDPKDVVERRIIGYSGEIGVAKFYGITDLVLKNGFTAKDLELADVLYWNFACPVEIKTRKVFNYFCKSSYHRIKTKFSYFPHLLCDLEITPLHSKIKEINDKITRECFNEKISLQDLSYRLKRTIELLREYILNTPDLKLELFILGIAMPSILKKHLFISNSQTMTDKGKMDFAHLGFEELLEAPLTKEDLLKLIITNEKLRWGSINSAIERCKKIVIDITSLIELQKLLLKNALITSINANGAGDETDELIADLD